MVSLNISYLKSLPGILRIVEVVLTFLNCFLGSLVCFGGIGCYSAGGSLGYSTFIFALAFIVSLSLLVIHLLGHGDRIRSIHPRLEAILICVLAILHISALITVAVFASKTHPSVQGQFIAAAIFAFVLMVTFGVDHLLLWRNGPSTPPAVSA